MQFRPNNPRLPRSPGAGYGRINMSPVVPGSPDAPTQPLAGRYINAKEILDNLSLITSSPYFDLSTREKAAQETENILNRSWGQNSLISFN